MSSINGPQPGRRNVLITSALPYVNNVPHLGNIIGSVLSADVFARFCKLRGYNAIHIGGTDEYGTATETKALELKRTPQDICDEYHAIHSEVYKWFNIEFDEFGRTTTELQTKIVHNMFKKLLDNDCLFKETVEQQYCTNCTRFLADRFIEGICPFCQYDDARGDQCDKCGKLINVMDLIKPKCKLCKNEPKPKPSEHFFFNLPKFQDELRKWFDDIVAKAAPPAKSSKPTTKQGGEDIVEDMCKISLDASPNRQLTIDDFHWTHTAKSITEKWLKEGLKPRCITRDLKWGTKVPLAGFEDKVFYVWFDAPLGYFSITAKNCADWEKWWRGKDVQCFHFMAKDNVPFHSILFKAALMGSKEEWLTRQNIIAVDYLNYENTKFSKSRGIGVFGNDAKETGIPADIWRFYLLYIRPEGMDSTFSWDDFKEKVNSELCNNLGNFINRALSFVEKNFESTIRHFESNGEEDENYMNEITKNLIVYFDNMERVHLRDGLKPILAISRAGNQLIQANKPWLLVKGSEDEKKRAESVMFLALNTIAFIAMLISPYIPKIAATIKEQVGFEMDCMAEDVFSLNKPEYCHLLPLGHTIGKPSPLFKRLEVDEFKKKYGSNGNASK